MTLRPITTTMLTGFLVGLAGSGAPARAGVIQLFSPDQLGSNITILEHTSSQDLLPSPHVVTGSTNVVTFTLAAGDWRRLDEGVNVVSDFAPGTHLLYTNNNNGTDLQGQGSIGGGGSGPAEIGFAKGVRAFGFRAQMQVLGFETLTVSAFNDLTLLGTFTVSRLNGQLQNDSASFLGVRATGGDVITRLALSGVVTQGGVLHENDFFMGPVLYAPEPSLLTLAGLAGIGLAARRRRNRHREVHEQGARPDGPRPLAQACRCAARPGRRRATARCTASDHAVALT